MAAEQGLALAEFNLGLKYDSGEGVPQDHAEAARWFRLAAEQGHLGAQEVLGAKFWIGMGVVQDLVMAYVWFNVAVRQRFMANGLTGSFFTGKRDKVLAMLNASQRRLAVKLSRQCFKKPAKCPKYSN